MFNFKVTSAGGIVVNPQGQVAIVEQQGQTWSFPKGHVERGENIVDAAKREIFEETGITDLELVRPLGTYQRPSKVGGRIKFNATKTIHLFLFRSNQQVLASQDPDNPQAKWVSFDEAMQQLTFNGDKNFLAEISPQLQV